MRCKKAQILLSVSLDGELSRREQSTLESHLSACPNCAREMAELSSVRDAMSFWADDDPSPWLAESFAHRLQEFQQERLAFKPTRPRWVLGSVSAGAAATLVVIGFLLHGLIYSPGPHMTLPQPEKSQAVITVPDTTSVQPPTRDDSAEIVTRPSEPLDMVESPSPPSATDTSDSVRVAPATRPAATPRATVASAGPRRTPGNVGLASRQSPRVSPAHVEDVGSAMAGVVDATVSNRISESLGETGLAMNETMERVRGVFQQTIDLMLAEALSPVDSSIDTNGGSTI